jgi:hypothetical protein
MDDELNVGNLLETRAERAPTTEVLPAAHTDKRTSSIAGFTVAAIVVALAIIIFAANTSRQVHVMERY